MCLVFSLYIIFYMFPGIKFVPFRNYMPKSKRHSEMKPGIKLFCRQLFSNSWVEPTHKQRKILLSPCASIEII